ncbi:uncharacterized protein J4E88_009733 [Alternaria novae-zelandiae]|uniref:uncharacterized protein n=1 Tax=Alternaria novae-zelandiae TaxID=430562 RepID=UPI0020C4E201|nr:uncharacterized protein J4E88_009733 [Alternaria novae-zelandiae]KAI4670641.1 hypothetical protein J4E88_009733 [Alternaria novae-zelandiae]
MKFATIAAIFAGIAAAAPTAVQEDEFETVTVNNASYGGRDETHFAFYVHSQHVDNVHCAANPTFEVDKVYSCDDSSYTFRVLQVDGGIYLRLAHVLNGPSMVGDFMVRMNGPIPIALSQVGTATADLDKEGTV